MRSSTAEFTPPGGERTSRPAADGTGAFFRALRGLGRFTVMLVLSSAVFAAESGSFIEVGYSPNQGAEQLVLKVVDSASKSLRVAAYSFTLPSLSRALVKARQRGVDVRVAVDFKMNMVEDRYKTSQAAMNLVVNAGIPIKTVDAWPLHHDKFIVADGVTVETGSFNFSASALKSRENVLVIWNNPGLAAAYSTHWQESWDRGRDYKSSY